MYWIDQHTLGSQAQSVNGAEAHAISVYVQHTLCVHGQLSQQIRTPW